MRSPTMLSIPKWVEMNEETKTKIINYKFLAGNVVEDSTTIETIEKLSIICSFTILLQWTMKLVDHLH